jgi:hypothetical protein
VRVFGDRIDEAGHVAELGIIGGADRALPNSPAIVAAQGHDVDLLARALTHVADVELARTAVEGEAPWIAHANGEEPLW